jgi:hypothetical protein
MCSRTSTRMHKFAHMYTMNDVCVCARARAVCVCVCVCVCVRACVWIYCTDGYSAPALGGRQGCTCTLGYMRRLPVVAMDTSGLRVHGAG